MFSLLHAKANGACQESTLLLLIPGIQEIAKTLHLPGGHSLRHETLESKLLLLKVIRGGVLNLKLGHGVTESGFDLLLVAALQFHGHGRVRDKFLNTRDVGLKLLARFEFLRKCFIAGLELGGVFGKESVIRRSWINHMQEAYR